MRSLRLLKSTHWVMWSSPLLLLVLVFTLTSAPSKATSPTRTDATISTTTSLLPPTTTTTTSPKKTAVVTRRQRTLNAASSPTHRAAAPPSTSTSAPSDDSSSSVIDSNVPSIANAPAENSASGALSGQLTARLEVAVVPLEGPGTWTVASSAPISVTLSCQGASIDVQTQFEIGARKECQVTITPASSTTSLTWQLTPNT